MNNSYLNTLPDELNEIIIQHLAAIKIQRSAIKMFYKKYGHNWDWEIKNYDENCDYYCYLNNINDPSHDYINYYREDLSSR